MICTFYEIKERNAEWLNTRQNAKWRYGNYYVKETQAGKQYMFINVRLDA